MTNLMMWRLGSWSTQEVLKKGNSMEIRKLAQAINKPRRNSCSFLLVFKEKKKQEKKWK